jgi:hypothetical protein
LTAIFSLSATAEAEAEVEAEVKVEVEPKSKPREQSQKAAVLWRGSYRPQQLKPGRRPRKVRNQR